MLLCHILAVLRLLWNKFNSAKLKLSCYPNEFYVGLDFHYTIAKVLFLNNCVCFYFQSRYKCRKCKTELLSEALEFRCCHKVNSAIGILIFDGSMERIKCMTLTEDFKSTTNYTVLSHVGPLLKDQNGKKDRKPPGNVQNNSMNSKLNCFYEARLLLLHIKLNSFFT